jgi:hypothetical protein
MTELIATLASKQTGLINKRMVCRPIERKDYKPGKVDETDERQIWIPDE